MFPTKEAKYKWNNKPYILLDNFTNKKRLNTIVSKGLTSKIYSETISTKWGIKSDKGGCEYKKPVNVTIKYRKAYFEPIFNGK